MIKRVLEFISKLKTCGICHGSGLINQDTDPKDCPTCKGKGYL